MSSRMTKLVNHKDEAAERTWQEHEESMPEKGTARLTSNDTNLKDPKAEPLKPPAIPATVARQRFKEQMISLINNSGLPAFMMLDGLEDIRNMLARTVEEQYQRDYEQYQRDLFRYNEMVNPDKSEKEE